MTARHLKRTQGVVFTAPPPKTFLTAVQLRARYGNRSEMWLSRIMKSEPDFPRSIQIGRYRLWDLAEIETYERALAAKRGAAASLKHVSKATGTRRQQQQGEAAR